MLGASGGQADSVPLMSAIPVEETRLASRGAPSATRRRHARRFSLRMGKVFSCAAAVSLIAAIVGSAGTADAANFTIVGPRGVTNDPTPSFSGRAEPEFGDVTLTIHDGATVGGAEQQLPGQASAASGSWKVTAKYLPDGTYTAQATQEEESAAVTFTVDATPPNVTLTSPANGSVTGTGSEPVSGTAGTELGRDSPTVTIQLFSGSTTELQPPLEALTVPVSSGGGWSGAFGGLSAGTYTARAVQSDWAGNVGMSTPATFTVTTGAAPGAAPPLASFRWFPAAPRTGENVSLVSSSTDPTSPITAFAWALTGTGPFQAGRPLLTTSFSTPGGHVVRLRVTDGNGLSSVATQTIPVTSVPLMLMQPFPIVRIAGSETSSGVRLSLLSAQAPAGARVTVSCRGRGCPAKSESRVVASSKRRAGAFVVRFRRFERALRGGIVLEIRISKPGQIGKYTRFAIRRGRLPARRDTCLGPAGGKPLVCPSS